LYLLLDTCFLLHSQELYRNNIIDIRSSLMLWRIAITHEVAKELNHYKLDKFIPINEMTILSILKSTRKKYLEQYDYLLQFDKADQSLWFNAVNSKNIVLTDDGELYEELRQMKIRTFRLPSFIVFLVKLGQISKNQALKCIKFWEINRSYKKKQLNQWKIEINLAK
jgi:rRNA-processing protein FCF1